MLFRAKLRLQAEPTILIRLQLSSWSQHSIGFRAKSKTCGSTGRPIPEQFLSELRRTSQVISWVAKIIRASPTVFSILPGHGQPRVHRFLMPAQGQFSSAVLFSLSQPSASDTPQETLPRALAKPLELNEAPSRSARL